MGKRILIADDSVTIQKAFVMSLGAEDLSLTAARSADEGLTLARQTRPDLIIADAVMPGRSGYELCASLKADAALRGTPVYILSSAQQPYDEAKGRQVGADGHLIKPWESGALIQSVKDALGKPAVAAPRATAASIPAAAFDAGFDAGDVRDTARTRETAIPSMPPAAAPLAPARAPAPAAAPMAMRPSLVGSSRVDLQACKLEYSIVSPK